MFWKKKTTSDSLPGPREIPELVKKHLVEERQMEPDLVRIFKAVMRKGKNGDGINIRIFDESDALARQVQVKDYTSLDEHPELTLYEGQYDEGSKQVQLEEKKRVNWNTTIFSEAEIRQKIESMTQPGSTIFFYLARGPTHGGPLAMGAAVIELNTSQPGKKLKKYGLHTADVVDMQPVGKGQKLMDSDKAKEIARWIKDAHHKRLY